MCLPSVKLIPGESPRLAKEQSISRLVRSKPGTETLLFFFFYQTFLSFESPYSRLCFPVCFNRKIPFQILFTANTCHVEMKIFFLHVSFHKSKGNIQIKAWPVFSSPSCGY